MSGEMFWANRNIIFKNMIFLSILFLYQECASTLGSSCGNFQPHCAPGLKCVYKKSRCDDPDFDPWGKDKDFGGCLPHSYRTGICKSEINVDYFKLFYTINVHVKRIMITIRRRKHPLVQTRNLEERSQLEEGKKKNFHRKKSQQAKEALLLWKII